jgi:hypothetical protein
LTAHCRRKDIRGAAGDQLQNRAIEAWRTLPGTLQTAGAPRRPFRPVERFSAFRVSGCRAWRALCRCHRSGDQ